MKLITGLAAGHGKSQGLNMLKVSEKSGNFTKSHQKFSGKAMEFCRAVAHDT